MIRQYVYVERADHRLMGFSLYNIRYNEATESFVSVDTDHKPYILQQPQSWGAIHLPETWREFVIYARQIIEADMDPIIPDSLTNRWPYKQVRLPCLSGTSQSPRRVGRVSFRCTLSCHSRSAQRSS
jgi:hypothetical protein